MILSDREIRAALERRAVRITPAPAAELFSSTAVDLTLDVELRIWRSTAEAGLERRVRPGSSAFNLTRILDNLTERFAIPSEGYPLQPGRFVLGWTEQKIQLPQRSRLAARVEGKSSLARLGLGVHV